MRLPPGWTEENSSRSVAIRPVGAHLGFANRQRYREPTMSDVPESSDAIDPDWLTAALSPRHPGVRVSGVEVVERAELTNHHCRLRLEYAEPNHCPETLFCKLLPSEWPAREAIAATGMECREAQFYDSLASGVPLRVPVPYVARHDPVSVPRSIRPR